MSLTTLPSARSSSRKKRKNCPIDGCSIHHHSEDSFSYPSQCYNPGASHIYHPISSPNVTIQELVISTIPFPHPMLQSRNWSYLSSHFFTQCYNPGTSHIYHPISSPNVTIQELVISIIPFPHPMLQSRN